jgi:hypothetical protein
MRASVASQATAVRVTSRSTVSTFSSAFICIGLGSRDSGVGKGRGHGRKPLLGSGGGLSGSSGDGCVLIAAAAAAALASVVVPKEAEGSPAMGTLQHKGKRSAGYRVRKRQAEGEDQIDPVSLISCELGIVD